MPLVYTRIMSLRGWLSVLTFVLIAVVLFFSRHELEHAWQLLGRVNLWILLLLIPIQMISYFASGEMYFSYLRKKGKINHVLRSEQAIVALEGNFVNHLLPSGGVSGVSYLTWRLGQLGISAGRATMSQVIRHAASFAAFAVLLLISLFVITVDGSLNRWIIFASAMIILAMSMLTVGFIYLFSSRRRTAIFSEWLARTSTHVVRRVTFGRKRAGLKKKMLDEYFDDMHHDFIELKHDKKLLLQPFLWGILFTILDAGMFVITFWALGEVFNPAPILIAYGVATMASFIVLTPGGAGAYEAIMVAFLAVAGIAQGIAIAGIVLTRVIILLGTIICGYIFYQRSLLKYGKPKAKR